MTRTREVADYGYRTYFKNAIINGNLNIWQRGTSFPAISNQQYYADRFSWIQVGTMVFTLARSTVVPNVNSVYSMSIACTTADTSIASTDLTYVRYMVEGYDLLPYMGKTVTFSFYVRSSKVGVMCVRFSNTGTDRSYVSEVTINQVNTWERKSVTLLLNETGGTWDFTDGRGLVIGIVLAAGTTYQTGTPDAWVAGNFHTTSNQTNFCDNVANIIYLAQIQLEIGGNASSFEFKPLQQELALCQRYYHRTSGAWGSVGHALANYDRVYNIPYTYPTEMRVGPTLTYSSLSNFDVWNAATQATQTSVISTYAVGKTSCTLNFTADGVTLVNGDVSGVRTTSGWLAFDAEL